MIRSPLEQFTVEPIMVPGVTNITLTGIIGILIVGYIIKPTKGTLMVGTWRTQVAESLYKFIYKTVEEQLGKQTSRYFPMYLTIFTVIMVYNVIAMVPYMSSVTAQIIYTLTFALGIFMGINYIAYREHGLYALSYFYPKGVPMGIKPLIVLIEVVSYIFRVISLSVRLFANMLGGHTLLKVIAGFAVMFSNQGWPIKIAMYVPLALLVPLLILELAIAFLQAYVWIILLSIYLKDALELH